MKLTHIISCLIAALFFTGCATQESDSSASASEEMAPATGSESSATSKTAYEGSTGSGLLMERYKSGNIEGFRD